MNPRISNSTDYKKAKTFSHAGKVIAEHPLSPGQRALWFLQQLAPESNAYSIYRAQQIAIELDIDAFRRTFQKLAERHAVLRTTFTVRNGEPVQRIHEYMKVHFQVEDASTWNTDRVNERLNEEALRPFNLEQGPLLRLYFFKRSLRDYVVLLNVHHIIADLWSLAIFLTEMGIIYDALKLNTVPDLSPNETEYTDYIHEQAKMLASHEGKRHWRYWQNQLSGELQTLNLPTDRPRPPIQTHRGAAKAIRLSVELAESLKSLGRVHKTTLSTTLLAAFQILLYRYTGQDDIIVGTPNACRNRKIMNVLGYFVNPLPIRTYLSDDHTFSEVVEQVNQNVKDSSEHADYPFTHMVEQLQPVRDTSRSPIFQVMFTWQKTTRLVNGEGMALFAIGETGGKMDFGSIPLFSMTVEKRVAQFDLALSMALSKTDLATSIEYNTDLFNAETIERMLGHFSNILESIVANPKQRIASIPLLTETERHQAIVLWNDTKTEFPVNICAHQFFENQVERSPDTIAVRFNDQSLTYRELNNRANQLARYLRKLGVDTETIVGICLERSLDMIICILGILKAGGAFLPLDPTYPRDRIEYMFENSGISVLLAQYATKSNLPLHKSSIIFLESDWQKINTEQKDTINSCANPDNLAYVLYTSGSTGMPKGVCCNHTGIINLLEDFEHRNPLSTGTGYSLWTSLNFDVSIYEIFSALLYGKTLHIVPEGVRIDGKTFFEWLQKNRIQGAYIPPFMLIDFLQWLKNKSNCLDLKRLLVGVEPIPESLLRDINAQIPDLNIINGYGPTEATVCTTLYSVDTQKSIRVRTPLGKPVQNTEIYILDRCFQSVPIGVAGEIYIGGIGLARGYFKNPVLTAKSFVPNPFCAEKGRRLYKTGDLARYLPDGNIDFLGRIDHQVKIRGFRIETGEIEANLREHPHIRDVIVQVREDEPNKKRLVAYIVAQNDHAIGLSTLRNYLKQRLPEHMIPQVFMFLNEMPLTPNGKVNKRALPAPDQSRPELEKSYVKPQNEIEKTLAKVWGDVLSIDQVGIHDNFFDLGGHSLGIIKLNSMLGQLYDKKLSVIEMFRYPTISSMAKYLSPDHKEESLFKKTHERVMKQKVSFDLQRQRMRNRRRN